MKRITRYEMVAVVFLSLIVPSDYVCAADGSVLFWNKLGSEEEVLYSEVGPGIQLTSYAITDWEQAQILPAQFGDGLFINHDINEGWANDGGNFFAINLDEVSLTPQRGTIEFWFKFKYDSGIHNHAYFFMLRNELADHFTHSNLTTHTQMHAGWNGWDYGSFGKRFFFNIGADSNYVILNTPDYSAAPGGHLAFHDGSIVHFAYVWDIDGIDETGDTARIYVNGNIEASSNETWPTEGGFDPYLYLGSTPNSDGWDHYYNAVKGITDNFIIRDYAKTDFSDRFHENPTSCTFTELTIDQATLKFRNAESVKMDSAKLNGHFVLGASSDGIDVLMEETTINIGSYKLSIPSGSFGADKRGYVFQGNLEDTKVFVRITDRGSNVYNFSATLRGIDLAGTVNPVAIRFTIGNDFGEQELSLAGVLKRQTDETQHAHK